MKRKTRKTLFYSSIVAFLILSALVVLYALGYQYDFVQNIFLKTGSFEIKTNTPAEVYVNDGFAGKTSFLSDYFSKSRLLPRAYSIRVQSDGYQLWQKLIKVDAGFLTSFPKVILLLKNFEEETITSSSIKNISVTRFDQEKGVAFIGNKQKIESINLRTGETKTVKLPLFPVASVIKYALGINSPDGTKTVRFNEHEVSVQWMKDSDYQPFKKTGDSELIARFPQAITDIQWYKDSEHLIVSVGLPGQSGILKFIEIDYRDGINVFDISTISGPFYYDKDEDLIYKFEGNKLVKINLK